MTSLAEADLAQLVDEWLDWDRPGSKLGVTPTKVRTWSGTTSSRAPSGRRCRPEVPAAFIDAEIVKGVAGCSRCPRRRLRRPAGIAWLFLDA